MSKNIKLNDTAYTGISTVELPTAEGATATFKDTDEIVEPSGTKIITTNGLHDVTEYANVNVNVSGDSTVEKSVVTFNGGIQETLLYPYEGIKVAHGLSKKPTYAIFSSDAVADGTLKGIIIAGAFLGDTYGYTTAAAGTGLLGVIAGSNTNTGNSSSYSCIYDEGFSTKQYATWYSDDTYIYVLKPAANQNFSADINYTLTCYA